MKKVNKVDQVFGCYKVLKLTNSPKYTYDCLWLCKCILCGAESVLEDIHLQHHKDKKYINGCKICNPVWNKELQKTKRVSSERVDVPIEGDFIYVIEAENVSCIKVGRTTDPNRRMLQLQSSCPIRLKFLCVFLGSRHDENRIHRDLRLHRMYGEWFVLCEESLAIIKNYMSNKEILYQCLDQ